MSRVVVVTGARPRRLDARVWAAEHRPQVWLSEHRSWLAGGAAALAGLALLAR